jgi:acetyl-CoA acetyltransferase
LRQCAAVAQRPGPKLVEDCIVGAGSNEGAQGYNIGRNVAVLSNLGIQCAGMTLNRFCSSGLQSIAIAANQIASGCSDIIVAGGVESITMTAKSRNSDNLFNPVPAGAGAWAVSQHGSDRRDGRAPLQRHPRTAGSSTRCKASSALHGPRRKACSTMKSFR